MLKQTTIRHVRDQQLDRETSYIAITMCHYPRGIKKEWSDQYIKALAPDENLFQDFKHYEVSLGHDAAFDRVDYEDRFTISLDGVTQLGLLCEMSRTQDVYLACQCDLGQKCHRELLLLIGREEFKAQTDSISNSYPRFEARLQTKKWINYRAEFQTSKARISSPRRR